MTATELLRRVIASRGSICLDTNCAEYFFQGKRPWSDVLAPVFDARLRNRVTLHTSNVTLAELLSHQYFKNRDVTGYNPNIYLHTTVHRYFELHSVDAAVAMEAGRLRGTYVPERKMKVETPDALIGATCIAKAHTLFISNDRELFDALAIPGKIYLKDLALEWLEDEFPQRHFLRSRSVGLRPLQAAFRQGLAVPSAEMGIVDIPEASSWDSLLTASFQIAGALNEPYVLVVLAERVGRGFKGRKVALWSELFARQRPPKNLYRIVTEHIQYRPTLPPAPPPQPPNRSRQVWLFVHASHERERLLQAAQYSSRPDYKQRAEAWRAYLAPLFYLKSIVGLPQVRLWVSENERARELNTATVAEFIGLAEEVLGSLGEREAAA